MLLLSLVLSRFLKIEPSLLQRGAKTYKKG